MTKLDQYGLPAMITVKLYEDCLGNVIIEPTNKRWQAAVSSSNAYNKSCSVFLQYPNAEDYRDTFPRKCFYYCRNSKIWRFTTATFRIDSYTFRHLVGGQCD
jgi:hypothetical protein